MRRCQAADLPGNVLIGRQRIQYPAGENAAQHPDYTGQRLKTRLCCARRPNPRRTASGSGQHIEYQHHANNVSSCEQRSTIPDERGDITYTPKNVGKNHGYTVSNTYRISH